MICTTSLIVIFLNETLLLTAGSITSVLLWWIDISHKNNNLVTDRASKGKDIFIETYLFYLVIGKDYCILTLLLV